MISVDAIVAALLARKDCRGDLLSVMPFGRAESLAFIKRHQIEIEGKLGRSLAIQASDYTASGRGVFGRLKGGRRAVRKSAAVFWGEAKPQEQLQ